MTIVIEGVVFVGDDAYNRVTYRGVTLNKRTAAMLIQAQRIFGQQFDALPQGSYHSGTSQSAGTHDGGGAVDIFDGDLDKVQRVMRTVGFAAWHRTKLPGVWDPHCHAIALGDKEMSDGARAQIPDYRNYLDGLASHAADPTWHPFARGDTPSPVFNYPKWVEAQDVQFDDQIPATDNKTVGDAFRESLRGDEQFAAIQANVKTLIDEVKTIGVELDTFRQNEVDRDKNELERDKATAATLAEILAAVTP